VDDGLRRWVGDEDGVEFADEEGGGVGGGAGCLYGCR